MFTRTELQAANTLTGNGATADVSGANCVVFIIENAPTGAAGIYTFEQSKDDGANWSALPVTDASTGAALASSASAAARDGFTVLTDDIAGDTMVRARISTAWTTAAPQVVAYVHHGS